MSEINSPLNRYIGTAFQQYYTWNNNTPFYVLAPNYLFQFYNTNVRLADEWVNGYVENFHSTEKGILPTQFANSLCHKLADLIYGDGVVFEAKDDKNEKDNALDFVSNHLDKNVGIKKCVKDAILKSVQLGNSLWKINCDEDNELWIDVIAGNRFFVDLDSRGRVVRSKTYVNIFTGGVQKNGRSTQSFGLVEERYWKMIDGEKKAVSKYCIYSLTMANQFTAPPDVSIAYRDLPRWVQNEFRENYGNVILDKEIFLPLTNLGVYLIKHTDYVSTMPNIKLGESSLSRIVNYLTLYDTIFSEVYNDIYITRAKAILPKYMGKDTSSGAFNGFDDFIYQQVPNKSDKEQTPIIFNPALRIEQFQKAREDCVKAICAMEGVATSSIFSDISDSRGLVTATEVNSENSNTVLYIINKRNIFIDEMNRALETMLRYYGYFDDVLISFSPAGGTNKSIAIDNTVKLKSAGLISDYEAIKDIDPSQTESQVLEELKEIDGDKSNDFTAETL